MGRPPRNLFADDMPQAQTPIKRAPRNLFANEMPQEEERGFWSKLLPNIGTGLAHAGRNLHNLPHDLFESVENNAEPFREKFNNSFPLPKEFQEKLNSMPTNKQFKFSEYLPYDTQNYSDVFGQKGEPTPTDYLIQKGTEYAPDAFGIMNALRAMKILPHLTRRGASNKLRKAQEMAANRDIGTLNVNPELIEDARQFLPDLLQNRNQLNASHAGDYPSLFKLQSDVGKISQGRIGKVRSLFAPESHLKGQAGLESRNSLLNAIHENLQGMGHEDISKLLREGQEEYRRYKKYRKYRNIIGTAGAAYAAPKNPLTDLLKNLWHAS